MWVQSRRCRCRLRRFGDESDGAGGSAGKEPAEELFPVGVEDWRQVEGDQLRDHQAADDGQVERGVETADER